MISLQVAKTQATITYQGSESRFDSGIPEAHELLWISCCNREMRFAAGGTAFTGELSERNTKFILCNSFFLRRFPGRVFPTDLRPRGSARGPRRNHHPHPAIEIVPASFEIVKAFEGVESASECKGTFEKFISLAGNKK